MCYYNFFKLKQKNTENFLLELSINNIFILYGDYLYIENNILANAIIDFVSIINIHNSCDIIDSNDILQYIYLLIKKYINDNNELKKYIDSKSILKQFSLPNINIIIH